MNRIGSVCALLSATALASPALAQNAEAIATPAQQAPPAAPAQSGASVNSSDPRATQTEAAATPPETEVAQADASGDIIVTALKGSASLQRTPAAVSVISSEDIVKRQLVDIRGLGSFLPSFKTNVEGTATQFFARGVGKQYDQARIPDAVALVVDGLNVPQHASGLVLFDISSIQVLPGPQGTLYGSSAIGGVVNITTNRPTRTLGGSVLVEGGNYGTFHATVVANIPVTDTWSVRAVYNGSYHGAYNNNGSYDDHLTAFRLSSLYEPDDSFSFFLSGTYAFDNYTASPTVPFPLQRNAYDIIEFDPATAFIFPPNGGITSGAHQRIQVGTVTAQFEKKLGGVNLSYTAGYAHKTTPGGADTNLLRVGGFGFLYESDVDVFNNELRISNRDPGRLNFIAGLYQSYHEDREFSLFGPNLSGNAYATTINTYAAFGQATYSILDATRLTGGLRVSNDQVKASRDAQVFFPIFPAFDRGVLTFNYDENWTRVNWKVGLEQDLGPASLLYLGVQSGFNPGTFGGDPPTPAIHVQPQDMIGYTAGIKNRLFGSRLTFNVEAFYYDYRNQIQSVADLSTGFSRLTNAQKSEIYGFQVDSNVQLARNTQVRGSLGYLHARYKRFDFGTGVNAVTFTGNTLPFAPEITASVGATQTFELGNSGTLEARADSYISSSYELSYDNLPHFQQGSFTKTDASLTYRPPGDRFEVGIWAKNLENKAIAASSGVTPGRPYPGVVYVEPPRTYGGRVLIKF